MDTQFAAGENAGVAERLLEAALPIAAVNGWNDSTFSAAAQAAGVSLENARAACPNKGLDLALVFHRRGDDIMVESLRSADLSQMRFRDRVALAVKYRFMAVAEHRDAVRKAASLFSVPVHSHHGAAAVWKTVDRIWGCLGDPSEDINWYTKRMTLSAVYGSSLLYWLGDSSPGSEATWRFIDRRIDDVMRIEGMKAAARKNPACAGLLRAVDQLGRNVRKPPDRRGYPGWAANGEN